MFQKEAGLSWGSFSHCVGCRVGFPHVGSGFTKELGQPSWMHSNWHQRGLQILAVMLLPASNTRAQNTVIFPPLLPVGFNHIEPIQAIPVNFSWNNVVLWGSADVWPKAVLQLSVLTGFRTFHCTEMEFCAWDYIANTEKTWWVSWIFLGVVGKVGQEILRRFTVIPVWDP